MDDGEIAMVETSWARAVALGEETVGTLLFSRIFELAPPMLELFSFRDEFAAEGVAGARFKAHAVGVVGMVSKAIGGLRDLDKLVPVLVDLGAKHEGYGVLPEHYDVVGRALVDTLEKGLGGLGPAKDAWMKVWALVSKTMLN
ncbi:hypothetical protein CTAYLR_007481 [Chrysophaeum taylorii]|uniref:Globin domain-containing protein n=1 Tax=Chrysophaeum taylorii TaxID=2483200 RepID=A0AAD7UDM5_9STRA|nr:hypothetical protein CTAYLR_007481 [Chrysophaeum taylorii]